MKYDEFAEENFNIENLSITTRLDNLKYSKWHLFVIGCLGSPLIFSRQIHDFIRSHMDFSWLWGFYAIFGYIRLTRGFEDFFSWNRLHRDCIFTWLLLRCFVFRLYGFSIRSEGAFFDYSTNLFAFYCYSKLYAGLYIYYDMPFFYRYCFKGSIKQIKNGLKELVWEGNILQFLLRLMN